MSKFCHLISFVFKMKIVFYMHENWYYCKTLIWNDWVFFSFFVFCFVMTILNSKMSNSAWQNSLSATFFYTLFNIVWLFLKEYVFRNIKSFLSLKFTCYYGDTCNSTSNACRFWYYFQSKSCPVKWFWCDCWS